MGKLAIVTKRAYEPASPEDGARFLVERLWPRGVKKDALKIDGWLKDVAPSTELRQWFKHDPEKWVEFRKRYFQELTRHPQGIDTLRVSAETSKVTLLFSARDTEHNNAVALKDFLLNQPGSPLEQEVPQGPGG